MITELIDVLSKDLSGKLLPTHDTQHAIKLVSGASLSDLPHHRMDPITLIERKEQVDDLPLEKRQQYLVPINAHVYEDKSWNYITIKDVGLVKDITIYDLTHVLKFSEYRYERISHFTT